MHILFAFGQFAMLQRDEFAAYCDNRSAPPLELDFDFEEESDSDSEDNTRESSESVFVRRSLEAELEANEMVLREFIFELSVMEGQLKVLQEQKKNQ